MKIFRVALYSLILVTFTAAVHAAVTPSKLDTYDSGCVDDFSTAGCFADSTPTGSDSPTVIACTAYKRKGQLCRQCEKAYDDAGYYVGYYVCAAVNFEAHCSCNNPRTPKCSGQGSCVYMIW